MRGEATATADIYFSDFFAVAPALLEEYGAFNISLVNDLPLFIDPFLLFNSPSPTYQRLHEDIIRYIRFLRDQSHEATIQPGLRAAWYQFGEVKQNWLGFSDEGNRGRGLGPDFAASLHANLGSIFDDFGNERITLGSHIEKVCLLGDGIGRDAISDFTTNLIKPYLLEYTEAFAKAYLDQAQRRTVSVGKVSFNYATRTWEPGRYDLPVHRGDFVLLTPKDILTGDETWISRRHLLGSFDQVAAAIPDGQLRALLGTYLLSQLPLIPSRSAKERARDKAQAVERTIRAYPEVIEYYIRLREESGDEATASSAAIVRDTQEQFVEQVGRFVAAELAGSEFYRYDDTSYAESMRRLRFLKHVIEDKDGYRIFYHEGTPVQTEKTLQLLFKFCWFATTRDVNSEVNNGRGPVDYAISHGRDDKCLVEFKLARNKQLKQNLAKQVQIYERASDTTASIKAICYFSPEELRRVETILRELGLDASPHIILIDARDDNKPSASIAA